MIIIIIIGLLWGSVHSKGNPNIVSAGIATRFGVKGPPPRGGGPKPSMLKKYLKETNLGIRDVILIFENILTKYSLDEIKQMVAKSVDPEGKKLSAYAAGICIAWIADCRRGMGAGGIHAQILDRKYGKAPQSISLTDNRSSAVAMSPEDRAARLAELEAKQLRQVEAIEQAQKSIDELNEGPKDERKDEASDT